MFVRSLPSLTFLCTLPFVLVNCSSDDPAPANSAGSGAIAGTSSGGSANGGGGASGGTSTAGMATAGSPMAGSGGKAGGASGGSGGAAAGGGGSGGISSGGAGSGSGGGGASSGGSGGSGGGSTGGTFKLTSAEIMDGMTIPEAHTCDGKGGTMNWGVAPSFKWENPPAGTMSYAFFMIDWTLTMKAMPDVNGYHSAAWNIPTTITSLNKGWGLTDLGASATGINGGYLGPCPPNGPDTYHMIIMALPMASYTISGSSTKGVQTAYETLKAVALGSAELTGTYKKK